MRTILLVYLIASAFFAGCRKTKNNCRFTGVYYGVSNCAADAGNMTVSTLQDNPSEIVFNDPDIGKIHARTYNNAIVIPYQYYYIGDHTFTIQGVGLLVGDRISIRTFSQDLTTGTSDSCFYYGHK